MNQMFGAALFTLASLAPLSGCGGDPEDLDDQQLKRSEASFSEATIKPTFQNVKAQVLPACSGAPACHRHAPFAGQLDLTDDHAYLNLVNVAAVIAPDKPRVAPFNAQNSFLYQKLTNTQGVNEGLAMPKIEGGTWKQLSTSQLSLLRRWIDAGAANN